ncbi:EAL domain-containing protein [Clostridium cuniculi]|uniref:EAL domain-containing protein n=1 Tax=Clostridium cuniculi TaxID=2548455 RepID=UPI0010543D80|nr:EAL domain-containing protein [Clostridium cuniculi]
MDKVKSLEKYLVYQPKVDFNTLEIIGMEALVRFVDINSGEILNTEEVVNSIGNIDDIIELTSDVLNIILLDMKILESMDCNIDISINISSKELCSHKFIRLIDEKFKSYESYINKIEIEITENYKIEEVSIMRQNISYLKDKGFSISIDDLGAGFNQIDMIKKYDVDLVKIDKSMVKNFHKKQDYLKYIIYICRKRNIKLLIEGIESKEDFDKFLDLGIEFGQGYYFYKPMQLCELIKIEGF